MSKYDRHDYHLAVMVDEVIEALSVRPGGCYVDATIGDGGHSERILQVSGPDGRVLGIDRDRAALARVGARLAGYGSRLELLHSCFERLSEHLGGGAWAGGVDGILVDLGVSSMQLDRPERGFSFAAEGPLDMRMDRCQKHNAADLLNRLPESELADLIFRYGEERGARRIARQIVARRQRAPLTTTTDLRATVVAAGVRGRPGHDPATRTFQALRIAVNDELGQLERFLEDGWRLLGERGRMVIITYHSLEDRLVKRHFARWAATCVCPPESPMCVCGKRPWVRRITRRKCRPTSAEVSRNPRARSAGLRVVERLEASTEEAR